MRCKYCGQEIPDGILYCESCGREVQIVPDYNPLDDMLTAHVKDSINSSARRDTGRIRARGNTTGRTMGRTIARGNTAGRATGRTIARGNTAGRNTGRTNARGNTARMRQERELRRKQAERRKALKKKKRRKALLTMFVFIIIAAAIIAVLYINSYAGIVRSGNKALSSKEYSKAQEYFEKAIARDEKRPEAYTGLSKVFIEKNELSSAENLFVNAIEKQKSNTKLYEAAFQFYLDTDQPMGIPELLSEAEDKVLDKLSDYVVSEPKFSLDDEEVYDDVQQLTITTDENAIYYTIDGSAVSPKSTKYTEPIQLKEGTNILKVIAVNKKGIPSQAVDKEYTIELPIEDAPAVSPSTGQYDYAQSIEIKVPDGYTAYYTTDGEDPTTASDKYEGPIQMPEGETLFKAILVSKSGRISGVTTRNYVKE